MSNAATTWKSFAGSYVRRSKRKRDVTRGKEKAEKDLYAPRRFLRDVSEIGRSCRFSEPFRFLFFFLFGIKLRTICSSKFETSGRKGHKGRERHKGDTSQWWCSCQNTFGCDRSIDLGDMRKQPRKLPQDTIGSKSDVAWLSFFVPYNVENHAPFFVFFCLIS